MNRIAFIADLHLNNSTNTLAKFYEAFTPPPQLSALYILGDFFWLWYGDDNTDEYLKNLKDFLGELNKKFPIYLIRGNRDFLLGESFAQTTGIRYLNDPTLIEFGQEKILLTHGDLLFSTRCYRCFRIFLRNRLFLGLFKKFPLNWRAKLSYQLKYLTKFFRSKKTKPLLNLRQLSQWQKKYKMDAIICGHIHLAKIHHHSPLIITLNGWEIDQPKILIWDEKGGWKWK